MKCLKVTSMLFAMTYVLALLIQFLPESVFKGDVLWFARAQHLLSSMAGIVFFMNLGFLARKHSS